MIRQRFVLPFIPFYNHFDYYFYTFRLVIDYKKKIDVVIKRSADGQIENKIFELQTLM